MKKIGLFSSPTTSTRHERVHANAFMAQRHAHELAQVTRPKTAEHFRTHIHKVPCL